MDDVHRYPAVEILMATGGIRNLIRTGQDHQIRGLISTGRVEGMMTMEQSLADLVATGRITREDALSHCYNSRNWRSTSKISPSPGGHFGHPGGFATQPGGVFELPSHARLGCIGVHGAGGDARLVSGEHLKLRVGKRNRQTLRSAAE